MGVLITGAGIVGSQIARQLVEAGERVVLFDIRPVPEHVGSIVDLTKVVVEQGDVTDYESLERVVRSHGIERVIHTAAMLTGPAREDPPQAIRVNMVGSALVLELARRKLVKRIVLAGSTTISYPVFDTFREHTLPEDFPLRVVSQRPRSMYSATKLGMEFVAQLYRDSYGVDAVVVRYAAVLGAWSGPNIGLVSRMVQAYLGPANRGETVIIDDPVHVWEGVEEFVDARDCASGTIAALRVPHITQGVYHISSDATYTHAQFMDAVRRVYPNLKIEVQVPPRGGFAGFPYTRPAPSDITAARRDLGYAPQFDLETSLRYFAQVVRH